MSNENDGQYLTSTKDNVEGPSESVQQVIVPKIRKRHALLRNNLQEAQGHALKGTLQKVKDRKCILDMWHI